MLSRVATFVAMSFLLVGCKSCRSNDGDPPKAVVEAETKRRLEEQPDLVKKLCGVDVKRLANVTVEVLTSKNGKQQVRVTGTPALPDGGAPDEEDDDDDDGGSDAGARDAGPIVTSKGKALVCAGVLAIGIEHVLDDDGKPTKWGSSELTLETVETGKSTIQPVSRPHHRRRHHHH